MREKIAKEIYEGITGLPWPPDDMENRYTRERCLKHAAAILSLPSGYIAGDHEITIAEALELFGKIVTDYPSYPHVGYYKGERISHDRT